LGQRVILHGGDLIESRSRRQSLWAELLASPGTHDQIWFPRNDLVGRHDPVYSGATVAHFEEISIPPAVSISSETQPMPDISGLSNDLCVAALR
jgi:hypothetical protein